jgi:hypothetical protein
MFPPTWSGSSPAAPVLGFVAATPSAASVASKGTTGTTRGTAPIANLVRVAPAGATPVAGIAATITTG